jgi:hypothetical protein
MGKHSLKANTIQTAMMIFKVGTPDIHIAMLDEADVRYFNNEKCDDARWIYNPKHLDVLGSDIKDLGHKLMHPDTNWDEYGMCKR